MTLAFAPVVAGAVMVDLSRGRVSATGLALAAMLLAELCGLKQ